MLFIYLFWSLAGSVMSGIQILDTKRNVARSFTVADKEHHLWCANKLVIC